MAIISSIAQGAWDTISHPFLQESPSVQKIGMGIGLCRFGANRYESFKSEPGFLNRVRDAVLGGLAVSAGVYLTWQGGTRLWNAGMSTIREVYFPEEGVPPVRESLHPNEKNMSSRWGESTLHLDPNDPRPKTLLLAASADHNGAMNPAIATFDSWKFDPPNTTVDECGETWDVLPDEVYQEPTTTPVFDEFDFKFKVIEHTNTLCEEIQAGVKAGDLRNIVVHAHGSSSSFVLSDTNSFRIFKKLPNNCFEGVPPEAKLFLSSCSTGADGFRLNVAEWLSWISGKTVYAPAESNDPRFTCMNITGPGELSMDFCPPDGVYFGTCTRPITRVFYAPVTLAAKAYLTSKMAFTLLPGFFNLWQMTRLGATALQFSGALLGKGNDLVGSTAKKCGIYHPLPAKVLHGAVSAASQILSGSGTLIHRAMDTITTPLTNAISKTGSFILSKSFQALSSCFKRKIN